MKNKKIDTLNQSWMNLIRKEKDVIYCSFMEQDGEWHLKVRVKNVFGGKDTLDYKFDEATTPKNIKGKQFEYIINDIRSKGYEYRRNV